MFLKNVVVVFISATIILIACSSSNISESSTPNPEYSLKLGDSTIMIDSVSTRIWLNEELNKDIISCKVYCTSGYPITDEYILKNNDKVCINIQAVAEPGKHLLQDAGDDWINLISFEFSGVTSLHGNDPKGKKNWINISKIDKVNGVVSLEMHTEEYISLKQKIEKKTDIREVIFLGNNIPFRKSLGY